jgi:hypothetical protein
VRASTPTGARSRLSRKPADNARSHIELHTLSLTREFQRKRGGGDIVVMKRAKVTEMLLTAGQACRFSEFRTVSSLQTEE